MIQPIDQTLHLSFPFSDRDEFLSNLSLFPDLEISVSDDSYSLFGEADCVIHSLIRVQRAAAIDGGGKARRRRGGRFGEKKQDALSVCL